MLQHSLASGHGRVDTDDLVLVFLIHNCLLRCWRSRMTDGDGDGKDLPFTEYTTELAVCVELGTDSQPLLF